MSLILKSTAIFVLSYFRLHCKFSAYFLIVNSFFIELEVEYREYRACKISNPLKTSAILCLEICRNIGIYIDLINYFLLTRVIISVIFSIFAIVDVEITGKIVGGFGLNYMGVENID